MPEENVLPFPNLAQLTLKFTMKSFVILLAAVAAFGVNAETRDPVQLCYAAMWANPLISPISARLETKTPEEALKLRTSAAKSSAKEKPAIAFWLTEIEKCQRLGNETISSWPQEGQMIIRNWQIEGNKAIADLYAGILTWGAFIEGGIVRDEKYRNNLLAFEQKWRTAVAQYEAEQKRQAEAERAVKEAQAQARYQALVAEREWEERQRQQQRQRDLNNGLSLLQQATQPRPTIRCNSTHFFDTTQTTCN